MIDSIEIQVNLKILPNLLKYAYPFSFLPPLLFSFRDVCKGSLCRENANFLQFCTGKIEKYIQYAGMYNVYNVMLRILFKRRY